MHATATTDRWVAVLEAIAFSPVRSTVVAVSVPDPIPDDLKAVVARSAECAPPDRSPVRHRAARGHRVRRSRAGRCPRAVRRSPSPRHPAAAPRRRLAAATATPATADAPVEAVPEPAAETAPAAEVEAAPEPAAEAAPVEAPEAPVEAPSPLPSNRRLPRLLPSTKHRPTHRVRLRFPPISLASLRRHGMVEYETRGRVGHLHPQPARGPQRRQRRGRRRDGGGDRPHRGRPRGLGRRDHGDTAGDGRCSAPAPTSRRSTPRRAPASRHRRAASPASPTASGTSR